MTSISAAEILRKLDARSCPQDRPRSYTGVNLARSLACHVEDPFSQEFKRGVADRIRRLHQARVVVQAAILATELNLVQAMQDEARLYYAHLDLWRIWNEIDIDDKPDLVRDEAGRMPVSDPLCNEVEERLEKLEKIRLFASRTFGFVEEARAKLE